MADIFVRGRHRVKIAITYGNSRYSMAYVSSEKMDYLKRPDGGVEINLAYNTWLETLKKEIGYELHKL
jgi:hypothetical protein